MPECQNFGLRGLVRSTREQEAARRVRRQHDADDEISRGESGSPCHPWLYLEVPMTNVTVRLTDREIKVLT